MLLFPFFVWEVFTVNYVSFLRSTWLEIIVKTRFFKNCLMPSRSSSPILLSSLFVKSSSSQDSSRGEYEATTPPEEEEEEEEEKTAKAPPDCLYYPMEALRWRRTVFENGTEKSGRVSYNFVGENFTVPDDDGKERFGLRVGNMTGGKVNLTVSRIGA